MKKLLIVVDMQKDFVYGALGSMEAQAIVPNVKAKIKKYQEKGDLIYFTQDTHYGNYLDTFEGKNLPVAHCIRDTDGWEIIDELKGIDKSSKKICKTTFGYEGWSELQLDTKAEEVELCGVCTDICVISNALALRMFYPEMPITVYADCCAGVTPEKHLAALEVMKSCQINVIGQ